MTRKTAPTDPKPRWRDVSVAAEGSCAGPDDGESNKAAALKSAPPTTVGPPIWRSRRETSDGIEISEENATTAIHRGLFARLGSIRASSWLISAAIHLVLLIILALLTYQIRQGGRRIGIEGALTEGSPSVAFATVPETPEPAMSDQQSPETPISIEIPSSNPTITAPNATATHQAAPLDLLPLAQLATGGEAVAEERHLHLGGGGMSARTPEGRKRSGDLYGATQQSENAVENALRWLSEHQRSDGSWSFDLRLSPCDGRCSNGKLVGQDTPTPSTAATGLALLAFLGAGYTSEVGPYQTQVQRGLYYLKSAAAETSHGFDWQQGGSMYGHGIALMAISEALGMTKIEESYDSDLLHHAREGTRFTVIAQHESGSWGYTPGSPGDTTLTGWQILSLIGAKKAGIQTRSDTFSRAKRFLMTMRDKPDYAFGYRDPKAEPTTTAIALTLLMYLGQRPGYTPFDEAIDKLAEDGPTLTNVYHDYYATMALHHFRHRDWEAWNTKLRDHLVRTQETQGHEAGSWHFRDRWGDIGGRVYTTAMSALILEVYYRFLPLYEEPPEFPL